MVAFFNRLCIVAFFIFLKKHASYQQSWAVTFEAYFVPLTIVIAVILDNNTNILRGLIVQLLLKLQNFRW